MGISGYGSRGNTPFILVEPRFLHHPFLPGPLSSFPGFRDIFSQSGDGYKDFLSQFTAEDFYPVVPIYEGHQDQKIDGIQTQPSIKKRSVIAPILSGLAPQAGAPPRSSSSVLAEVVSSILHSPEPFFAGFQFPLGNSLPIAGHMKIEIGFSGRHPGNGDEQFFVRKNEPFEPHPEKARNLQDPSRFPTLSLHGLGCQSKESYRRQQGIFLKMA